MIEGLNHITLIVSDLERMSHFMTYIFEAREIYSSGEQRFSTSKEKSFLINGLWFAVMEGKPLAEKTYDHVALKVAEADFETYVNRVRSLNVDILEGRDRIDGEGKSLYFYDYDNHLFELHTGTLDERLKTYTMKSLNYDEIAGIYDDRYKRAYRPEGIASKLLNLARELDAERILEAACGTGHWLEILQSEAQVYGIDLSLGMLRKANERKGSFLLINGDVGFLPFLHKGFDMICSINALHHFNDPSGFVKNSHKLLKQGGALVVIGMDPHSRRDKWFIYDYFSGTYETDLRRYPSSGTIMDWMISAGFKNIHWQVGERIIDHRKGREVFSLSKEFTSQLSLLSSEEYENGISRIESALHEAEAAGETLTFQTDILLSMVTGRV